MLDRSFFKWYNRDIGKESAQTLPFLVHTALRAVSAY